MVRFSLPEKNTRIVSIFSASIKRNYVLQGRKSSPKLSENGSIVVFGENEKTKTSNGGNMH